MKRPIDLFMRWMILVAVLLALEGCAVLNSPGTASPVATLQPLPLSPLATLQPVLPRPVSPIATQPALRAATDFTLQRENGQTVRLSDWRGRSSVVLVFYRGQT